MERDIMDGIYDWSLGMDSSLKPDLIAKNSVALAANVSFRGGRPSSRYAFKQMDVSQDPSSPNSLTYLNTLNFQGASIYYNQSTGISYVVIICGGYILFIDEATNVMRTLNPTDPLNANAKVVHNQQAAKYMVFQDGVGKPLVWDGNNLSRSSTVPIGTKMAYGQGRLFVCTGQPETDLIAGDLVYGGSTTRSTIVSSSAANPSVLTTIEAHAMSIGDLITITGHASNPDINGEYYVLSTPSSTTFSIAAAVTTAGTGGIVVRANQGSEADLLNFTETTYLSEGGSFKMPAAMGKIVSMVFMPIQDTATGQGDMLIFCERGTVSLQVSQPRDNWKSVQMQRVVFSNIGASSPWGWAIANSDIYFFSSDGIRSYKNARAEFGVTGNVGVSSEMTRILNDTNFGKANRISAVVYNNRFLMTALPTDVPLTAGETPSTKPVKHRGIISLDFTTISGIGGKRSPAYDGIWTGLEYLKLTSGTFGGVEKCFAVCLKNNTTNTLWEISAKKGSDDAVGTSDIAIKSIIETRSFDFESPFSPKKLNAIELYLSEVEETITFSVWYKPDAYPCWFLWNTFSVCNKMSTCVEDADTTGSCIGSFGSLPSLQPGYRYPFRIGQPNGNNDQCTSAGRPAHIGNQFQIRIDWTGIATIDKLILFATTEPKNITADC